jgi:hypothetical protein
MFYLTVQLGVFANLMPLPFWGRLQVPDEFLLVASSSKSLVPKDHAEVSAVARAVMLSLESDSTAIPIVTIRHWLAPRSHTRPPIGFPCGQLS